MPLKISIPMAARSNVRPPMLIGLPRGGAKSSRGEVGAADDTLHYKVKRGSVTTFHRSGKRQESLSGHCTEPQSVTVKRAFVEYNEKCLI
jgi:hypothetical protein